MFLPVRMLARQGEHFGFDVKQFANSTPSPAIRSNAGVLTHVQPYAPACGQPQSSAMAKRMLGRLAWAAAETVAAAPIAADIRSRRVMHE